MHKIIILNNFQICENENSDNDPSTRGKGLISLFKLTDSSQTFSSRSRNARAGLIFVIVLVLVVLLSDMLIFSLQ